MRILASPKLAEREGSCPWLRVPSGDFWATRSECDRAAGKSLLEEPRCRMGVRVTRSRSGGRQAIG